MNANIKEIADGTMFQFVDVIDAAVRVLDYDMRSIMSYLSWNYAIRTKYCFVVNNGKVYVTDQKQQMKPVTFYNSILPTYAPDTPLLNAVTGKLFVEKLNDAILAYHNALNPAHYKLRFTYDIAKTYRNADQYGLIHSCMSHHADDYASDFHPCKIYEREIDKKVMLAYMTNADNQICARTLCDMSQGIASRLYCHRDLDRIIFTEKLLNAGIDEIECALADCRFPVVRQHGGAVFPYLDRGTLCITDDGSLFVIFEDTIPKGYTIVDASYSTSGIIDLCPNIVCDCCGDHVPEESVTYIGNQYICDSCRDSEYVWSEYAGDYIRSDDAVYSEYLSDYIPSDDAIFSECLQDYLIDSDTVSAEITIDGGTIISDYFPSDYDQSDIARMLAANVESLNTNRRRRRY
jgi:hypothetical protein